MAGFERRPTPADDSFDDGLDDALRTTLRTLSDQARTGVAPVPAGQIRSLGTRRRTRRLAGSALLGVTVLAAVAAVSVGALPHPRLDPDPVPPAASSPPTTTDAPDPTPDPLHDVGYLVALSASGGRLVVTFDRVTLQGQQVVNKNPKMRTFTLTSHRALIGVNEQDLIDQTLSSVATLGHGPLVTLAHRGNADGVVTRLQELTYPTG
jgi:hypothetical protein